MVKLVERYSDLKLPFTYEEFFALVQEKIKFQLSLIRSTDKLAMFFNAVNSMISELPKKDAPAMPDMGGMGGMGMM
jgi:hypothetical protein